MDSFVERLQTIRDREPAENIVVCAEIYHDGSFNIFEYDENDREGTIDILEAGSNIADLNSFYARKDV